MNVSLLFQLLSCMHSSKSFTLLICTYLTWFSFGLPFRYYLTEGLLFLLEEKLLRFLNTWYIFYLITYLSELQMIRTITYDNHKYGYGYILPVLPLGLFFNSGPIC